MELRTYAFLDSTGVNGHQAQLINRDDAEVQEAEKAIHRALEQIDGSATEA